jgi:hypothetical protein
MPVEPVNIAALLDVEALISNFAGAPPPIPFPGISG